MTFQNMTERRQAEAALRESEARQRFLLELNDRLRPLADPAEIQYQAARALGEHLGASRVGYAEDQGDGETIVVTHNYADGVPSIEGRYCYGDYDPVLLADLRQGRTVLRGDIADDPALTDAEKAAHAALQIGATANVPLVKAGRLVAVLFVHYRGAHAWPAGEQALLEGVAERIWAAVERARAEDALRQAVERYERQVRLFDGVASTTPDFVYLFDLQGRFRYANRRLLEVWGMRLPEVIGKTCRELGYEQWHHDMHMREIAQVIETKRPIKGEVPFKAPLTGVFGVYEYIFTPVTGPDGEVELIAGTTRDVTERKRAEEELRYRGEQFQTLLDEAPLGVYLVDADFRIVEVNPVARTVFGDIPDLVGRDFGEVIHILWEKTYADEVVGIFRRTLDTGEPYVVPERAELRADRGVTEYYEWRINRIPLPDGRHGVVCYFRDISPHVNAREALREADRRKDEFIAMLSHELRNPLAPVRNALEILNRQGTRDPQLEAARSIINRQVGHMVRIIDDLLDVSRITRGKLQVRRERITLETVLEHALETARPHLGHHLHVSLPRETIDLEADPTRLSQVFANLLNNACKYTPKGGHIWLTAERDEAWAVVKVRDDGIGIPSDQLPRVFEVFSQIEPASGGAQGGLGIGLSLAQGLVELHGGSIEARSPGIGMGSEFIVRLPVLPAAHVPAAQLQEDRDEIRPSPAGHRVLVVDDNEDSAHSLALLLGLEGHEVETAHDGAEAVEKADAFRPDVIVLDIGLPKMNGYEACRAIRARPWARDTVIVALTGWGQEDDRRKSAEAGFDRHLVKPIDPAALFGLLRSR